jgi:hypothetical protein
MRVEAIGYMKNNQVSRVKSCNETFHMVARMEKKIATH